MSEDWGIFTDDLDDMPQQMTSLLPSSLKDIWEDDSPLTNATNPPLFSRSPTPQNHFGFPEFGSQPKHTRPFPFAESAPALSFMDDREGAVPTAEPEISILEPQVPDASAQFFLVQFHPNRVELFKWNQSKHLNVGDYVLTEADRGYDVGHIVEAVHKPTAREIKSAKSIVRTASHHEIAQLPTKVEREAKAKELCQQKAKELGLPMLITGAEFQFDGKKLTFYYTASDYVDFRNLVRALFKTFGMRIWMVWHDGNAPVRDVLQRNERH